MGASNSRIEEDKALQLCRERKKFVRQALDARCSLAASHVTYIQSLKIIGTDLRKFVESEAPTESSLYTSTSATPEPLVTLGKPISQFSFSSPSLSQHVDANENLSPSPSPPASGQYHANHMEFRGTFSRKVEQKPPTAATVSLTSSSTPQGDMLHSTGRPETLPTETPPIEHETPAWDYFGLFHSVDNHMSLHGERGFSQQLENADDIRQLREAEGIPELEDEEEKTSTPGWEYSQESEDEFDDPTPDTLVRSFENFNRAMDQGAGSASQAIPSTESVASEAEFLNGEKINSPDLSPLGESSPGVTISNDVKGKSEKQDDIENKVVPKDFITSMKDIEFLFIKASESGKEVPRMLEANKFHFRPIFLGKEGGSLSSTLFKNCFACGDDPSQVQEEPPQNSVKYLTWHRTTSSRSSSSRNPLGANTKDDIEDVTKNLFDEFCMISGSHASTLDRLHAWERKLYDEVKASQLVRREYDLKCKLLRQLESKVKVRPRLIKLVLLSRIYTVESELQSTGLTQYQRRLKNYVTQNCSHNLRS
ncbi:hypothetical protein NMG60_11022300 [Bertholletia excelsa]